MSCFTTMSAVTAANEFDLTKHVKYTGGMILGVDDFTQEFAYLSGRDRWIAREALGYGTVSGLKVRTEEEDKGPRVMVEPGVAISPRGQLICVSAAQCAYLNQWLSAKAKELHEHRPRIDKDVKLYVVLCYRECPTDDMPIPGEPCRSEKELSEPSRIKDDFMLELRLKAPEQPEEKAVRDYCDFLRSIEIIDKVRVDSTPMDIFLDTLRDEFLPISPPRIPRPVKLHIHPKDVSEYIRRAFHLWTKELRIPMSDKKAGCAVEMTAGGGLDDCVLLAELLVPVTPFPPGRKVKDEAEITLDEETRPILLHLRMLQEWMLNEPNDHGSLTGLEDDDHKQYLLIDGTRAMTGTLDMGSDEKRVNKIVNLTAGTDDLDALNFAQVVTGDLAWNRRKALTIAKLQGKNLTIKELEKGQILIFKDDNWINHTLTHGELAELTDDDHPQYLLVNPRDRALIADLDGGKHKIVNLAAGEKPNEAMVIGQRAGGDLRGTYPEPSIDKLQGHTVEAGEPGKGHVLIFDGRKWVTEKPAAGATEECLLVDGTRPMKGALNMGVDATRKPVNKIVSVAAGEKPNEAMVVGQAARGDLDGSYPNPIVIGLRDHPIAKTFEPKDGDVLTWQERENERAWIPKAPQGQAFTMLPLATITRIGDRQYEVWFNLDVPGNLALIKDFTAKHLTVFGETTSPDPFLFEFKIAVTATQMPRNVFVVVLTQDEMNQMRFKFNLSSIRVTNEKLNEAMFLAEYAAKHSLKFPGQAKEGEIETATIFVRRPPVIRPA